ncbi:helix-turn-helix domain-containing protein [Micromonospora sp. STR1s_5]|nr:helix-turn-helix domain-containing protein [Micromonospora sp. STR1s_5]
MTLQQIHNKYGGKRPRLDTPAAADYLGLGKSTLDKLRLTGGGPQYSKYGRRVVYDPDDLDSWSEQHKRRSTSDTEARAA